MYITFALFFISLAGIIVMIGRKLAPIRNGQVVVSQGQTHPFIPDLQKIKNWSFRSFKKYEHLTLVAVLRFYVRFSNFLKYNFEKLKNKMKNMREAQNGVGGGNSAVREPSKFLKMVSEYKQKVSHIKHRITEEEDRK